MFTIPSMLLAIAFGLAAVVQVQRKHWEQVFTRLLLAAFYGFLFVFPELEIETARALARWFTLILALVEILTFLVQSLQRRRLHDRS